MYVRILTMNFTVIEKLVNDSISAGGIPSAVIAIGDCGGTIYKKAFGLSRYYPDTVKPKGAHPDRSYDGSVAATLDTVYDMASLSKLISTSMVALRLVEMGELCLSDTVNMFFEKSYDKGGISVKQLMTHQSGIAPYFDLSKGYSGGDIGAYVTEKILSVPLEYKTGEHVRYSCMGFILLGKIIESITGKTLDVLAQELVFDPLGMKRTGYCPKTNPRFAHSVTAPTEYDVTSGRYIGGTVHDENARFQGGVSANAGVFSCIDDLCIFSEMLANHGATANGCFLSRNTFDAAITNITPWGEEYRGLGFALKDEGMYPTGELFSPLSYGHTGFTGTSLFVDRATGMYLIILTNRVHFTRESGDLYRLRRRIGNAAISEYTRSGR